MKPVASAGLLCACGESKLAAHPDAQTAQLDAFAIADARIDAAPPATLTKHPTAVVGGPMHVASDPSVRRVALSELVMRYTCLRDGTTLAICEARSSDGLTWTTPSASALVAAAPDTALESAEYVDAGASSAVYAASYGRAADPAPGYPATLMRITGITQTVALAPTAGSADCHGVYSPTIRGPITGLEMIYVGHCYTDPLHPDSVGGLALLGAKSTNNGQSWTRTGRAVEPALHAFALHGLAERQPGSTAGRAIVCS